MKVRQYLTRSIITRHLFAGIVGASLLMGCGAIGTSAQSNLGNGGPPPTFTKAFAPSTIGPGSTTTLTFTIANDGSSPVDSLAFTDTLPAGQLIADPASASTDCGGSAILSAPDGGTTISLSNGRVAANSSCTVTVNIVGSVTGLNVSGSLTSTAGNSGSASATLTVDTTRPGFSKSFSPDSIPLGGTSTLTFTIDNSSNASAVTSFFFSDTFPGGMVIATPANATTTCANVSTFTATPGSNSISFFAGSNAALSTCTVSVDVTTNITGTFDNVSAELTTGTPAVSSGFATDTLEVPVNFLVKSFINDPALPGGTVDLQFTIQNPSRTFPATAIAFDDNLPAGLTFNSLLSNDCGGTLDTSTPSLLSFSGGTLAPEGSCTLLVRLDVPVSASPGEYANTTTAITATIDGDTVIGNMATDILTVNLRPTFTKEFIDDPSGAGGQVTLRFTITNNNPNADLENLNFTDDLNTAIGGLSANGLVAGNGLDPAPQSDVCGMGSELTVSDPNDSLPSPPFPNLPPDPTMLIFTGGNLAAAGTAGDSCTFDVVLDIPSGVTSGVYTNTSSDINGTFNLVMFGIGMQQNITGLPASDDLTIVGAPRLMKEFTNDPAQPGGTVTLRFTIEHEATAPGNATGITFSDDLNATLTGLEATGATVNTCGGMAAGFPTNDFQYSGGSLMPGQSCTIELTLSVPAAAAGGTYPNTTSAIQADVGGLSTTGGSATDDLRIAGVTLTKEFLDDPTISGDTVTLRFTLANINQNDDATNINFSDVLSDVLPGLAAQAPLPDTSACGASSSLSGTSTLNFSDGELLSGASCSFDVTVLVPGGTADGDYNNITSAVAATLGGSPFTGDTARDVLTVNSNLLQLTKEFTDDPVAAGDPVTLEFDLTNLDSAQAASMIDFTDDLNATVPGLIFDSVLFNDCGATISGTSTTTVTVTGATLTAGGSCTIRVSLTVPGGTPTDIYTNTTSAVSGVIGGFTVSGDPATDTLNVDNSDSEAPMITYTPIAATNSTANPTINATVTDNVAVDRVSIAFSVNGGAFSSNPCTLASGTAQNGTWDCTITGTLSNPSAIAYYISASDVVPNAATNPAAGAAAPNLFTIGIAVVPGGTYTNVNLGDKVVFGGDVTVNGVLTLGGIVGSLAAPLKADGVSVNGAPTLTLGCTATVSGGGPANYLVGNVAKQFCAPGMFTYPVGTVADGSLRLLGAPGEFSPLTANVTALGTNPSTLTVAVTDDFLLNSRPSESASRFWSLTETGDLTADISFTYLDQDVNGDELGYKVLRQETAFAEEYPGGSVDPGTNTATAPGVTEFSSWAAGVLGPTAAPVDIGGRILTPSRRGIFGARVFLTDSDGNVVMRQTNPFGYYRFTGVDSGETYVLTVQHKGYSFEGASRVVFVENEDFSIDIIATGRNTNGAGDTKTEP